MKYASRLVWGLCLVALAACQSSATDPIIATLEGSVEPGVEFHLQLSAKGSYGCATFVAPEQIVDIEAGCVAASSEQLLSVRTVVGDYLYLHGHAPMDVTHVAALLPDGSDLRLPLTDVPELDAQWFAAVLSTTDVLAVEAVIATRADGTTIREGHQ